MNTPALTCDVCGSPACGVAGSALGACSFAYCRDCLAMHAEPYGMTVAMCAMNGAGRECFAPWFWPVIEGTCRRAGKTEEEFWAEVRAEIEGGTQ